MKDTSYALVVLFALAGALRLGSPARAEVIVHPIDSETVIFALTSSDTRAKDRVVKLDTAHSSLVLPYFEANPTAPVGDATFFAVRNSGSNPATLDISYLDQAGNLQAVEAGVTLDGLEVLARDLRTVPGLTADADGVRRGWVHVAGSAGAVLSGDYFQVDEAENFASGSRLIGADERCRRWDVRFFQGGGFDGGTVLQIFTNNPQGTDPLDPITATFLIYDGGGFLVGSVGIQMDRNVETLPVGNLLAALPGGIGPAFGSLLVDFVNTPGGGHVQATYSALGRYSVGVKGNCLDALP